MTAADDGRQIKTDLRMMRRIIDSYDRLSPAGRRWVESFVNDQAEVTS